MMRWLPTVAILVSSVVCQATVAPHLVVAGAEPNFVLTAALLAGLATGATSGGLYGVAAGLTLDIWRGREIGLFALGFGVAAWLAGQVGERIYPGRAAVRLLTVVIGTVLAQALVLGVYHLTRGRVAWHQAAVTVAGQVVYNAVLGVILYRPFRSMRRSAGASATG